MMHFALEQVTPWLPPLADRYTTPYKLGAYDEARIRKIMWKYLPRKRNLERAWARINMHLPETLVAQTPLSILEFSTAHGAMLEIWRDQGHHVRGTDFGWAVGREPAPLNREWKKRLLAELRRNTSGFKPQEEVDGWLYQPIIESLGLDVDMVDGRKLAYPYKDKSFDVVCCYQAIEAYAPPEQWVDVVREFCRIARCTVVLGFNPPSISKFDADFEAAKAAWHSFQQFNDFGFRVSFFEIGKTRRGTHPTACKLVAAD